MSMHKKRLISQTVGDGGKDSKKLKTFTPHDAATPTNDSKSVPLQDALAEEYQPQFLNYMLVGDLVAIMILHSKDLINKKKLPPLVKYENFCHSSWFISDVLNELKSKKNCYPIAKNVILAVGYNDYCCLETNELLLVDGLEKIILKLQKRGCEDILLTNIPPAAARSNSIKHWQYLNSVNTGISILAEKYEFVGLCNVFKLFGTPKNYFKKNKDYVTFGEINYKVDVTLYSDSRRDMVSFSELGKRVLGKHVARSIENRVGYLRSKKMNNVICSIELSDSEDNEDVEVVEIKKRDPSPDNIIVDVETKPGVDFKPNIKSDIVDTHPFNPFCTCKNCNNSRQSILRLEGVDEKSEV